ncbi:hypothetical protein DY000_02045607 [Brassica cretica]|uniref:Uncharacterized protein n=1 Tax=Brassica cretica TaxID=69181 RepID=A0ABQ7EUX3_BRACR|nr:hypothetical protein DY000_02045607 [Brassica cretica]
MLSSLQPPSEKLPPPELKSDGSVRFPWDARLIPESQNLYRAATPTYRLHGTPERCGSLEHKAKRCLLPSMTTQVSAFRSPSIDTSSGVPVVDMNTIMQQKKKKIIYTYYPSKDLHTNEKVSLLTSDCAPLEPQKHTTVIESLLSEFEITTALQPTLQQENPTASPNFFPNFSILVDSQSTHITTPIMEPSPSTIINTEVCDTLVVGSLTTTSNSYAFDSPSRFKGLGDVDEVVTESSSSLNLTRGGRETKTRIKYQNIKWKTIRGRGKYSRRGRGSYH